MRASVASVWAAALCVRSLYRWRRRERGSRAESGGQVGVVGDVGVVGRVGVVEVAGWMGAGRRV